MAACIDKPNNLPDIQYVLGPDDLDSSKIQESLKLIEIEYNACYDYCMTQAVQYVELDQTKSLTWGSKAASYTKAWERIKSDAHIITENTTGSPVEDSARQRISLVRRSINGLSDKINGWKSAIYGK
jgi:hypothetical protein